MLYDLIQTRRGKEKIVMTDSLPKVNDRMRMLRQSQRKGIKGDKVTYRTQQTTVVEKFKEKPHNLNLGG